MPLPDLVPDPPINLELLDSVGKVVEMWRRFFRASSETDRLLIADVTAATAALALLPTPASGIYTPALFNGLNVAATTAYPCAWYRVGTTVTVFGQVDVDPVASSDTNFEMALPIASNLAAAGDLAGVGAGSFTGQGVAILGNLTTDKASFNWTPVSIANQPYYFRFSYRVL